MPFRDSLSRFKGKVKKKLHLGSGDANSTLSSAHGSAISIGGSPGSAAGPVPRHDTPNDPSTTKNNDRSSSSTPKADVISGTGDAALPGIQPHAGSNNGNLTLTHAPDLAANLQTRPVHTSFPTNSPSIDLAGVEKDKQPTDRSIPEPDEHPTKAGLVWTGARLLFQLVNETAGVFPPLKSAISGLNECINIYQSANTGSMEYGKLLGDIDKLLDELRGYLQDRGAMEMTGSVRRVCCELDSEVKIPKAKLEVPAVERRLKALDAPSEITQCHGRIQRLLERLTLNANVHILQKLNIQDEKIDKQEELIRKQAMERRLKDMNPTLSSMYNSSESDEIRRRGCTRGTRQAQIQSLLEWARTQKTGKIYWMNGMAGTGKTTIAYSICARLDSSSRSSGISEVGDATENDDTSMLGASFFCSRVIPECRRVKNIIPTIAYQLARYSLSFFYALHQILESEPDVCTRALKTQYEKLILKPLEMVQDTLPTDFIVVIDALDECENVDSLKEALDLLLSTPITLPIRFLVSSRPEPEISRRMEGRVNEQGNTRLVLHNIDADMVKSDIELFMRRELKDIPLTDTQWLGLLKRCGVLFIYASTTCLFIRQEHDARTLNEAVNAIIGSASVSMGGGDEETIDELYTTILRAALGDRSRASHRNKQRMRDILETVICAGEPIRLEALVGLLALESSEQVEALLQPLRSVLNIITDTQLVTTLHASFPDFMFSEARSEEFHCKRQGRDCLMAKSCLSIIGEIQPAFNICGLSSSYLLDIEVENLDEQVNRAISPELAYACRYWSIHLHHSEYEDGLVSIVRSFFERQLLVWVEVLNLTKQMRFGTSIIQHSEMWCMERHVSEDLTRLTQDAGQFVSVYANHPISQSTPHIYVSMLPFWPQSRPVSVTYMSRYTGMIKATGTVITRRRAAMLATWRVSSAKVQSISLSADGTRIAADTDDAIDLFDTSTGEGLLHVQEAQTKGVCAVAISPDGAQIAFGSQSGAYLLDVRTRQITELHPEKISGVLSVVFSPKGSHVAIGSQDRKAYICSGKGGDPLLHTLEGRSYFMSVTFSPDGRHVASESDDTSIRIWDIKTGQMVGNPLLGHTLFVLSIAYSPDGSRLASSSADGTIRVWDPQTSQTVLGPLAGHSSGVWSVTFSPDGSFIASGSGDMTIRLYDTTTGQTILGPLQGHTQRVNSVIVTPDSARLLSCSHDGTIRLWNVQDRHVPDKSHPTVPSDFECVRYSADGLRVVSGSDDGTVCVWDVQTGDMVLGPLEGHTQPVCAVDYSPNGAYIASASLDCTLRIWSAQDGKDLHGPIQGHTRDVNCVRFSPDSSLLVSGSFDSTVRIWDAQTGQQVNQPLQGHSDLVRSVAFSPNGSHVVSGSDDGTIRVWDIQTGQTVIDPLRGHERAVMSVEFSPDGSRILSGSWYKSMRMWDAVTGQTLLVFGKGHDDIISVGLSPDGGVVVSGSVDGTVCVWDAQSGDLMLTLQGHTERVRSVQFSPDGSHVVSCSWDGTIRFWDVSSCQAHLQDHRMKDGGKSNDYSQIEAECKPWTLRNDGWVVDRQDQRLVWVPSDLQPHLLPSSNDFVIPKARGFRVNFSGVNVGDQWTKCYQS